MFSLFGLFVFTAVIHFNHVLLEVASSDIVCHNDGSCQSDSIFTQSSVQCYGYQSCYNSSIQIAGSSSASTLECRGSNACWDSTITILGNTSMMNCAGLFSCKHSDIIYDGTNSILCHGEGACSQSAIRTSQSYLYVYCEAYRSCADAQIHSVYYMDVNGAWAAHNTTFYSVNSLRFRGAYSGYGATIYCAVNTTCSIECHSTGCVNLTTTCTDKDSESCTFSIDCADDAIASDLCPNGIYNNQSLSSIIPDITLFTTFEDSTIDNSINTCEIDIIDNNAAVSCNDYLECDGNNLITNDRNNAAAYGGSICCLAYFACQQNANVTSNFLINETIYDSKAAFRCDGSYSCDQIGTIKLLTNNVNVYSTGRYSINSQNTKLFSFNAINNLDKNTSKTDIYCMGFSSCFFINIIDTGRNIYSLAEYGISNSNIKNFQNVYCYSAYSCYTSVFNNINNIYCSTHFGCNRITANNINRIMACGKYTLEDSNITNINDYVIGYGKYSLSQSSFTASNDDDGSDNNNNNKDITCYGSWCLYDSVIDGFDTVTAIGDEQAMYLSTIISVRDEITAIGTKALQSAIIYNNQVGFDNTHSKLNCTGKKACYLTEIHGISRIVTDGDNSMKNSTIYSEMYNGNKMQIDIYSDNIFWWYLYCNASDICIINCYSNQACTNLRGNCEGLCAYNCNETRSIDCPDELTGNTIALSNLTNFPTSMPTIMPSDSLSYFTPTAIPSSNALATTTMTRTTRATAATSSNDLSTTKNANINTNNQSESSSTLANSSSMPDSHTGSDTNASQNDDSILTFIIIGIAVVIVLAPIGICVFIVKKKSASAVRYKPKTEEIDSNEIISDTAGVSGETRQSVNVINKEGRSSIALEHDNGNNENENENMGGEGARPQLLELGSTSYVSQIEIEDILDGNTLNNGNNGNKNEQAGEQDAAIELIDNNDANDNGDIDEDDNIATPRGMKMENEKKKKNMNEKANGIKNKEFSSQLLDKSLGVKMMENDIVDEMEFDKKSPNAITKGAQKSQNAST